jgi:hypothetical protein
MRYDVSAGALFLNLAAGTGFTPARRTFHDPESRLTYDAMQRI